MSVANDGRLLACIDHIVDETNRLARA